MACHADLTVAGAGDRSNTSLATGFLFVLELVNYSVFLVRVPLPTGSQAQLPSINLGRVARDDSDRVSLQFYIYMLLYRSHRFLRSLDFLR